MRAAPPVEASLASGRAERAGLLAMHLGAGMVLVWWLRSHGQADTGLVAAWLSPSTAWVLLPAALSGMALLGWALGRRSLAMPGCRLRWDGQRWWLLLPAEATGADPALPLRQVDVQVDLGPWLLLRLQPDGTVLPVVWAVCAQGTAGVAWHGLKVALLAHAGAQVPSDAAAASSSDMPVARAGTGTAPPAG